MFNTTLNAQLGFPAAVAPLKFDTPGQVKRHHRTNHRSCLEGLARSPPSSEQRFVFHSKRKGILRNQKGGMNERTVTR